MSKNPLVMPVITSTKGNNRYIEGLVPKLADEPLAAYELFGFWIEAGGDAVEPDFEEAKRYFEKERYSFHTVEEMKRWPEKYKWKDRYDYAKHKITARATKSFKYEEEVAKRTRWQRSVDLAQHAEDLRKKLEKRLPQDIENMDAKDRVTAYIQLMKLIPALHREQREEKGQINPQVNITIDMLMDEAGKRFGTSPELVEAAKQLALKEYVPEAEFKVIEETENTQEVPAQ